MNAMIEPIKEHWQKPAWRVLLVLAVLSAVLHLALVGGIMAISPRTDLDMYIDAGQRAWARQPLYPAPEADVSSLDMFNYSPVFAAFFAALAWLPSLALRLISFALHLAASVYLYILWARILCRVDHRAPHVMAGLLPLWLVFTNFWTDLHYLNVAVFLAVLASLALQDIIDDRPRAGVWLFVLAATKPYWAFAAALPLIGRRWRTFLTASGLAAGLYLAAAGLMSVVFGPQYVWGQHVEMIRHLASMPARLPYQTPASFPVLYYNHSLTQMVVYLFGLGARPWSALIKAAVLAPAALLALRGWRNPLPETTVAWFFVLYAAAWLWLDLAGEWILSIAAFTVIVLTINQPVRKWAGIIFVPYALLNIWRLVAYLLTVVTGLPLVTAEMEVVVDPSMYFPMTLVVILSFYSVFLAHLTEIRRKHTSITRPLPAQERSSA